MKGIPIAMVSVIIFGFIFNSSRWFELETISVNSTAGFESGNETRSSQNESRIQVSTKGPFTPERDFVNFLKNAAIAQCKVEHK